MTFASFFSLATSVATSRTLMPAARGGGSVTFSTSVRGERSTPSDAAAIVCSGFCFAYLRLGSVA